MPGFDPRLHHRRAAKPAGVLGRVLRPPRLRPAQPVTGEKINLLSGKGVARPIRLTFSRPTFQPPRVIENS